jgi:hypothetical protein
VVRIENPQTLRGLAHMLGDDRVLMGDPNRFLTKAVVEKGASECTTRSATEAYVNYEELYWLRELCREGALEGWPPDGVVMSLAARGFLIRRFGAIGLTDAGRSAAELSDPRRRSARRLKNSSGTHPRVVKRDQS